LSIQENTATATSVDWIKFVRTDDIGLVYWLAGHYTEELYHSLGEYLCEPDHPGLGLQSFDAMKHKLCIRLNWPHTEQTDEFVQEQRQIVEQFFTEKGWIVTEDTSRGHISSEVIASSDNPLVEAALRGFHPPVHDTAPTPAQDYVSIKWFDRRQAFRSWLVRNAIAAVVVFVIVRAAVAAIDALTGRRRQRRG